MMQWMIEQQDFIFTAIGSFIVGALIIGGGFRQKMQLQQQLFEQQLHSEQLLYQTQIQQLQQSLQQANHDLDELDEERDKAAYQLQQLHGQWSASVEKLRYFDVIKQERQQFFEELNRSKESKAQLDSALREQTALRQQENQSHQEKLQLLIQAEERLKQQFEHLANQLFEEKTAKVDQQNRQSLDAILSPLKEQLEGFKKQVNDNFGQ